MLAVIVADTATVSQKLHGKPKEQSVPAGTLGFFPYSDAAAPYVHRVTARGAGPFINIGLDFQDPVTAACASTLPRWNEARAEGLEPNRRGQGYRLTLPPAADVALPTGGRGLLLAPLGSAALQVDDDAWAAKVGDFRFYDIEGERPARLRNNGKEGATLIVFDAC